MSLKWRTFAPVLACALLVSGCNGPLPVNAGDASAQRAATGQDLLYVTEESSTAFTGIDILSYPEGQLDGQITDVSDPGELCGDHNGNVFIPAYADEDVLEYSHGGTIPIATFFVKGYHPVDCAVDPVTGDLAVTSPIADASLTAGDIAIFKPGHTTPSKRLTDPRMYEPELCAYDDSGNLYAFGVSGGYTGAFSYGILRPGKSYMKQLHLSPAVSDPGQMQWDGANLAVIDTYYGTLVRYAMKDQTGTKIGETKLKPAGEVGNFWIYGGDVVAPESGKSDIGIWKYPAGGKPAGEIAIPDYAGSLVISPGSTF